MNQAIHNVDLLCWLMGDVSEITGFTGTLAHERIEVEDTGVACLKFVNGAIGVMEATTAVWPGLLKKTEIHGSRGTAIIEQDSILRREFADEEPGDAEIRAKFAANSATSGGASDPKAISFVGHQLQLQDFVESIQTGQQAKVDGAEGRRSVEIILALYEAAKTGHSQRLQRSVNVEFSYLGRSQLRQSSGDQRILELAPNLSRDKVAFDALLKEPIRFREAMSTLHDVVINDLTFQPQDKAAQRRLEEAAETAGKHHSQNGDGAGSANSRRRTRTTADGGIETAASRGL